MKDDRERTQLISRIQRNFDLAFETIEIGSLEIEFFRVVDPNVIFNEMVEQASGSLPWHPYWAETWDAAETLSHELTRRDLVGRRVMDLGCGLGLPGTVAAALGAEVEMVDAAPPSLLFARLNSWPWRERVGTRCLDWSKDRVEGPAFDFILGSDITYDCTEWPHLEPFLRAHLAEDGHALLVDPCRSVSDEFIVWLGKSGWNCDERVLRDSQDRPIRLVDVAR